MNPLQRPPKPVTWDDDVADARSSVQGRVDGGADLTSDDFEALWRKDEVAIAWETAQHRLCGYCSRRLGGAVGAMDHYRPKTEFTRTILATGAERADSTRVRGRKLGPHPPLRPAWPELAYAWDNYVYACQRCNTGWKRTLFPALDPKTGQKISGRRQADEQPLLLSPFELGDEDPPKHFAFDERGAIRGLSSRGQATIDVCGLHRPSLTDDRMDFVEGALRLLDDLDRPGGLPRPERRRTVCRVVTRGGWGRPFAAHVAGHRARARLRLACPRAGGWVGVGPAGAGAVVTGAQALSHPPHRGPRWARALGSDSVCVAERLFRAKTT